MKSSKLLAVILFVFTTLSGVVAQNPKREVVFKLNANEVIDYNEYYLMQTLNQNRFACMIKNTSTDEYTFVFNGQRIKHVFLRSFNVSKDNGYIFTYEENGKCYINYNGTVAGGFEDIAADGGVFKYWTDNGSLVKTPEKDYDYLYKLAGKWYARKNGKNKKINFIEAREKDNGKWHVTTDDNTNHDFDDFDNRSLRFTESGKYAYTYVKNGKWYTNINGKVSEGSNYTLTEDEKYTYTYKDSEWYINIAGNRTGPYYYIDDLTFTENGKYAYLSKMNGIWHININGDITTKASDYVSDLTLSESGKYAYSYKKDGKYYTNDSGYVSENNNVLWWDAGAGEIEFNSDNGEHSFYSSYKYEYVVIDGNPYAKSPACQAWYDKKKKAFVWTAVEDKELVVYEYKTD